MVQYIKKVFRALPDQFRSLYPVIGKIALVSALFLMAMLVLHWGLDVKISHLTRDPVAIMDAPPYLGFLSSIGILLWSATGAICLFSAGLISKLGPRSAFKRFLFISGFLTLILVVDDLFLLHEEVIEDVFSFDEKLILVAYFLAIGIYLLAYRDLILETDFLILGGALFFFGISTVTDKFPLPGIDPYLQEDGAKLIGIVSWLAYYMRTSAAVLRENLGKAD